MFFGRLRRRLRLARFADFLWRRLWCHGSGCKKGRAQKVGFAVKSTSDLMFHSCISMQEM